MGSQRPLHHLVGLPTLFRTHFLFFAPCPCPCCLCCHSCFLNFPELVIPSVFFDEHTCFVSYYPNVLLCLPFAFPLLFQLGSHLLPLVVEAARPSLGLVCRSLMRGCMRCTRIGRVCNQESEIAKPVGSIAVRTPDKCTLSNMRVEIFIRMPAH